MVWLLILALVGLALVGYDNYRLRRNESALEKDIDRLDMQVEYWFEKAGECATSADTWQAHYQALEEGADEQADSYEQQFLTFKEQIEARDVKIEDLSLTEEFHTVNCLPQVPVRLSDA